MSKLSVVIPTLNEGNYIKNLLDSLENQNFQDFEVIVSDSGSKDNTLEIAREYGAKIVEGPKKGPGHGRNMGAEKANGKYLLFADADVKLPKGTLSKIVESLENNEKVIGGTSTYRSFDGGRIDGFFFYSTSKLLKPFHKLGIPVAPGFLTFVEKETFEEIGGYDEDLPFCEDHKLAEEMQRYGKMKIVDCKILVSARRLNEKGTIETLRKYFLSTLAYAVNREYLKKNFEFKSTTTIENKD